MLLCRWCQKRNPDGAASCQYCGKAMLGAVPIGGAPGEPQTVGARRPAAAPSTGPTRTSGMAISSLVLGILGLPTIGITAVVGLILGIVGLRQIDLSEGRLQGRGMAIAGATVSGLVLTLMVFLVPLAAVLFPVFAQAREKARAVGCTSNLRHVGMAMMLYAQDYDERLPPASSWCDGVLPYVRTTEGRSPRSRFYCPSLDTQTAGQAYNASLSSVPLRGIAVPRETVLAFDAQGGWNLAGGPKLVAPRHNEGLYMLFVDGRTEWRRPFEQARWKPAPPAAPPAKQQRRRGRRGRQ